MGDYIILAGRRIPLRHHATDFIILGGGGAPTRRVTAREADRDTEMDQLRRRGLVVYHVYETAGGGDLTFDDVIEVKLRDRDVARTVAERFHLNYEGSFGSIDRFRVTADTAMNPLKAANRLDELPDVESAQPRLLTRPASLPADVIRARLTRSQARKGVNDSIRAVSAAQVDDRTEPLSHFGIFNGPRLDSFKAELCNAPNGVPQFPGFELDPESLRDITTDTAVEDTDGRVQDRARREV